ncbi:histidine kinase [Brevundimonas sp.]|uniref:sensor histidine kinase n=1 Tax=Brevundimonas sp. TaxID=1871086 RepID=UPI0026293FA3|nr:histidine kinase [Brevundimonas sp.]
MSQPAADALTTDLRSLFRDSEARAARLRLLIQVSRDLAATEGGELDAALATAARRAAWFAGYGQGAIRGPEDAPHPEAISMPFETLAARGAPGMRLELWARRNPDAQSGEDDAEALRLLAEMIEARLTVRFQHASRLELLDRLARRETELEQVLSRVVGAQEAERRAISADLHDGVAQQIAALHRRLELLQLDLPTGGEGSLRADVEQLIAIARAAVGDVRALIAGLRPTSLDDLGVMAALREEARRLEDLGHVVTLRGPVSRRLPDWLETLIFRLGQEALNNAAKHAPGAEVTLDLVIEEPVGTAVLTVQNKGGTPRGDDGDGGMRFGLDIMRERLSAVAGRLEAGPVAGGFRIRAIVPLTGA